MKARLKNPQWAGFSSYLGPTKFKDGVSENDISKREADLIGSITAIELIDEDGKVTNAGFAQRQTDLKDAQAPIEKPKIMGSDKFDDRKVIDTPDIKIGGKKKEAEKVDEAEDELDLETKEEETTETTEPQEQPTYTMEELEIIADKEGITGLREIGDNLDVKSNSIEDLMKKIVKAQRK